VKPLAFIAALTVAISIGVVAPASADEAAIGVLGAKNADGPYRVFQNLQLAEGQTKTVYWKVINPRGTDQEVSLDDYGTGTTPGFRFTWFKGAKAKASQDITSQVSGSGYDFTLDAGDTRQFSTKVKRTSDASGACVLARVLDSTSGDLVSGGFSVDTVC
jgi:hypothetical protein